MTVRKRAAIISVIVLISGLAILGYFLYQGRRTYFTDPYKAVAPTASFVIESADIQSFLNSLTTGKGLFGEAAKVKEFEIFNQKLKFLADQLNNTAYKKLMTGSPAIISFHKTASGKLQPLLTMAVPSEVRLRQMKVDLRLAGIKTLDETTIRGNSVLSLPFTLNNQKGTVFISILSGLLICSSAEEIMEKAMEQTTREDDIRNAPGFSRVLEASGKNEDKFFVVFGNLPGILKSVFNQEYSSTIRKIGSLAGSAEGDIYINDNGLVLSGYTESTSPENTLYRYKTGKVGVFRTYKILPSSTVLFESVFLNGSGSQSKGDNTVLVKALDLASRLREYTDDEVTKAYIDIRERPADENIVIIYELKNRAYAEKVFLDVFSAETGKTNILYFQPDEQIKIPVFVTPYKGFSEAIIPGFKKDFNDSYFTFYDNFLITGSSYITVSRLLYDNLLNKTLANDLTYRDFESTLPTVAGYFFYCVPSRIIDYLDDFLGTEILNSLRSNKSSLEKIQALGYQFTSSNEMIYNSLSVRFREEAREESTTEWETLLDTVAAIKPFFFTNHITGAREIFIQDMKNNAYLINAAGRVLWKVPLRERVSGTIFMIDYFRNGKYQLLFSGRNYLHLLDRNGNYVERYPVKLRSPATNSLALFDYDNNLNYRLLIAGEDRMIYAYDRSGSAVKGWNTFRTAGPVIAEVSWCRVSGKDYLAVSDNSSIYLLDRTGNIRLQLKEPVTKAAGSSLRLSSGSSPSLVCTSPEGSVQHIYFDGSVNKFSIRSFSVDHAFDFFDVDGDGFGEYIFIDKGILYLYDHNRTEMFSREFGSPELGGPINFIFSASDRKIGVFDISRNLIYLIDQYGKTMSSFPLRGASMFSIGKLSEKSGWHLIVGGTDRFLYNYRLDTEN
ncbi:MAG: hypothetical protein A2V64_06965 [Bacteroidetes bacterium RBG_13_43_22]|nr:MAG: hypothetical protein A2V64_06965 [Bacteroidetes bacterium RBG_13_43_22]